MLAVVIGRKPMLNQTLLAIAVIVAISQRINSFYLFTITFCLTFKQLKITCLLAICRPRLRYPVYAGTTY
jgi:hypothetical protein